VCAYGAQTILSLTVQAITVLARSTPLRGVLRYASPLRVTLAPRRDAPVGVGTRNVPQDSTRCRDIPSAMVACGFALTLCPMPAHAHLIETGLVPVYDGISHFAGEKHLWHVEEI
jgi:hypothetical protein